MAKRAYAPVAKEDVKAIVEFTFFRPVPCGIEVVGVIRGERDARSL